MKLSFYSKKAGGLYIFPFVPTPASKDEKPRVASPVNIFAKIEGDIQILNQFSSFKRNVKKV